MDKKHLLNAFSHCPKCGSSQFHVNDERSKRCKECGFVYYLNASAAAAAFIINGRNELLVATRAKEPARGTLDLPGGFIDPGETIEEGLQREVFEETGCHVESMEYLFSLPNRYMFSGFEVPTTDCFFICRIKDGEALHAHDDVAALRWIPIDGINAGDFGLGSIKRGISLFLSTYGKTLEQRKNG